MVAVTSVWGHGVLASSQVKVRSGQVGSKSRSSQSTSGVWLWCIVQSLSCEEVQRQVTEYYNGE